MTSMGERMTKVQKKRATRDQRDQQALLGLDALPRAPSAPDVFVHRFAPARVTAVYESYWRFACERQAIYMHRISGAHPPWTDDPVLRTFKFTNAYRAADRVSQYLIRNVIYRDDLPSSIEEVFFRTLLFKLFNKIETWELIERELGPVIWSAFDFARYDRVLSSALAAGQRIYSAAYIMPPGGSAFGHTSKHQNHLSLLQLMMRDGLAKRLADARTMQAAFELLKGYPTMGDFLAYQFVTDINYSNVTNFSEMSFVVPGPGARDGISKAFADTGGLSEVEIIQFTAEIQEAEFERLGLKFASLWGRPLQLIDCQNLFCEISKYARAAHPDVVGVAGRTRIKQKFAPRPDQVEPWFPPKWGLNETIAVARSKARKRVESP